MFPPSPKGDGPHIGFSVDRPISGEDNVRLIGIDTPETVDPGEPVQPLGPEASAFTTEQLEGQEVALEFDQERVDSFGRPLAYVWSAQDELFNETLVREGLAQVATFPPNTRYEDRFLSAQEQARAAGIGIWGLSTAEQCQLADRNNGIGEGSPECTGAAEPEQTSEEPEDTAASASPEGAEDTSESEAEDTDAAQPESAQRQGTQPEREDRAGDDRSERPRASGLRTSRTPDTGGPALLPLAGAMMTAGFSGLLVTTRRR